MGRLVFFSLSDDLGCNPLKFSIETENEDLNFSIFQILVKYFPRLQPFIEKCGLYLSGDDTYATVRQRSLLNIIQNFPNSGTESSPIFLTANFSIKVNGDPHPIPFIDAYKYPNALNFLLSYFSHLKVNEFYTKEGLRVTNETRVEQLFSRGIPEINSTKSYIFHPLKLASQYIDELKRVMDVAMTIETSAIAHFLKIVKYIETREVLVDIPHPFCFVTGPSGSGKTLLSYVLERFHLCIRFNMAFFLPFLTDATLVSSQDIYWSQQDVSGEMYHCVEQDFPLVAELVNHKMSTSFLKTTFRNVSLRSLGFLKKLLEIKAEKKEIIISEDLQYEPISLEKFKDWLAVFKKNNSPLIFLDEFSVKSEQTDLIGRQKHLIIFVRNLFASTGIPLIVMGTEASAANLLDESQLGTFGSSGSAEKVLPWCIVISKLPKPTKRSIISFSSCHDAFLHASKEWDNFAYFMGLKGDRGFPSFRPLVLELAFEYIKSKTSVVLENSQSPLKFLESMIFYLHEKIFLKKASLKHELGLCAQFAMHFPKCRDDTFVAPVVFLNSHFALLRDPRSPQTLHQDSVIEGSSQLLPYSSRHNLLKNVFPIYRMENPQNKHAIVLGYEIYDGESSSAKEWSPLARLPKFSEDVLMYLVLHTFKDGSCFRDGASNSMSTFKASKTYFGGNSKNRVFQLQPETERNGLAFEHVFHAAIIVSSQRQGLAGSSVMHFVLNFLRELDIDYTLPTAGYFPQILKSPNVKIPFYPSVGASLSQDLLKIPGVCSGTFNILPKEQRIDGLGELYPNGKLCLECKNWRASISDTVYEGIVMRAIHHFKKNRSEFNLHLFCANDTNFQKPTIKGICSKQDEDFVKYIESRWLYFYRVDLDKSRAKCFCTLLQSIKPKTAQTGVDFFLIFTMKDLFRGQDFSFIPPNIVENNEEGI